MKTLFNKKALICIGLCISSIVFGQQHTIINKTSTTKRVEGRNTQVPEDLYFSELIKPGESRTYQAGAHWPYFAIDVIGQKEIKHSGQLPKQGSTVMIKDEGDSHTLEMHKKNEQENY